MNEVFNFEGANIRTVMVENEPMFVGKDVAEALGYSDTPKAIKQHVDEADRITLTGQNTQLENIPNRGVVGINESGVYSLIFDSKLDSAKRFKKWVTSEVLPSIRQTGTYTMRQSNQQHLISPKDMMRAQLDLIDEVKSDQAELRADVDDLKENMGLPHIQAQTLLAVRKKHVASLLGGYDSNAYFKMSGKVFARMGRGFKDRFEVPRYDAVPLSRFDEALEYTKCWRLPTNMQLDAQDLNAQMALEV